MMAKGLIVIILITFVVNDLVDSVGARSLGNSSDSMDRDFVQRLRRNFVKRQDEEESGDGFGLDVDFGEAFESGVDDDENAAEDQEEEQAEDGDSNEDDGESENGDDGGGQGGDEEGENSSGDGDNSEAEESGEDETEEEPEEEPEEEVEDEENGGNYVNRGSNLGRRAGNSNNLSSRGGSQNDRSSGKDGEKDSGTRDATVNNLAAKFGAVVKSIGEGFRLGTTGSNEFGDEPNQIDDRRPIFNRPNSVENLNPDYGLNNEAQDYPNVGKNLRPEPTLPLNNNVPPMVSRQGGARKPNALPPGIDQRPNNLIRNQIPN